MLIALHLHDRLMEFRIERLSHRLHRSKPFGLQRSFQLAENHIHTFGERAAFLSARGRSQRPFEVVQHRQQLRHQLGCGILRQIFLLFQGAPAEVVIVGLYAQDACLVFVGKLLQALDIACSGSFIIIINGSFGLLGRALLINGGFFDNLFVHARILNLFLFQVCSPP
ncbi:hypothetical protein D3C73_1285120 [compost metagenome]